MRLTYSGYIDSTIDGIINKLFFSLSLYIYILYVVTFFEKFSDGREGDNNSNMRSIKYINYKKECVEIYFKTRN